jgi:alpha-amylase
MKSICLVLYTHQPITLKNYRFYDIGKSNVYFNEASNKELIQNLVQQKFTPVNKALMKIFQSGSNHFKISFSFSGTTLDLLENSSPEMIRDLKKMNEFGYVEFLSETYSNSILSKKYQKEFLEQTKIQKQKVLNVFGQVPKAFLNVSGYPLPFLSSILPDLGFNVLIQFNSMHSKSHGSSYFHSQEENINPIKILETEKRLLNQFLVPSSNSKSKSRIDIDSFLSWVKDLPEGEDVVCIALDYSNLISENSQETFLLDFIKNLPKKARKMGIGFCTPSELFYKKDVVVDKTSPAIDENLRYSFDSPEMNIFQKEIFDLLIDLKDKIYQTNNKEIVKTWFYLQDQGLFKKMEAEQNPESEKNNAIQFYITYRNVLNDFTQRVEQSLLKGSLETKPIPIEFKNYPGSNAEIFNMLF